MSGPILAALFATVALLVVTAYFIMGSIPLLVLKHDTPLDARFVRGFFAIYYKGAFVTAGAASLSYAVAGRLGVAVGAAGLALLAGGLRRAVLPRMEALGSRIQSAEPEAVAAFRRVHLTAIAINVVQLIVVVWCLIALGH